MRLVNRSDAPLDFATTDSLGPIRAATLVAVVASRIAIACCRRATDGDPTDLYPDPDAGPLSAALEATGATAELVAWDDPSLQWDHFDTVVVSSTWDSVDRPGEYLAWTARVSECTRLVNPATVLAWGLDKTHQRNLSERGVPVIPTTWVEPGHAWQPPGSEFVVKPAVSAGSRSTARYRPGESEAARRHVHDLHRVGQIVMLQPYIPAVGSAGETDIIFFGGTYSHAVRKRPILQPGRGVVDRPWEQLAWDGLITPAPAELEAAELVMEHTAQLCGSIPTYARVDLVAGLEGEPLLLEIEVIDPLLSFDLHPPAAATLARLVVS